MHIAENLAALRDLALDLGEGQVVQIAVGGHIALNIVGGKVMIAVGEVRLDRPGNRAEVNVSVRFDADAGAQPGRGHVAFAGIHRSFGAARNGDG